MKKSSLLKSGLLFAMLVGLSFVGLNAQQLNKVNLSEQNPSSHTYTLKFSQMDMAGTVSDLEQFSTDNNWSLSSYDLDNMTAVLTTDGEKLTGNEIAQKVQNHLNRGMKAVDPKSNK